jgi:hypothetical protein
MRNSPPLQLDEIGAVGTHNISIFWYRKTFNINSVHFHVNMRLRSGKLSLRRLMKLKIVSFVSLLLCLCSSYNFQITWMVKGKRCGEILSPKSFFSNSNQNRSRGHRSREVRRMLCVCCVFFFVFVLVDWYVSVISFYAITCYICSN